MQRGFSGIRFALRGAASRPARRRLAGILATVALAVSAPAPSAAGSSSPQQHPPMPGLVEVALPARADTLLLVLSGDGGLWGDIDLQLAQKLAARGYAVVALDTAVWFKHAQTASAVAARLERAVSHYLAETHADRVALVGYSYGADVIPVIFPELSPGLRARLTAAALIAPGTRTQLHVTLGERTGLDPGDIQLAPYLDEMADTMPRHGVICLYSDDDGGTSGCELPEAEGATLLELPGGHHFNNDVDLMAQTLAPPLAQAAPP